MWNISPSNMGNAGLPEPSQSDDYYRFIEGGGWGSGHSVNPLSGAPYPPNVVPRGDFARVLAEYWADGPSSETPPGHWFTILNHVHDHPMFERRFKGAGPLVDVLEWDVKAYLVLGGAMHDAAISAWGVKGWYDYVRPISALRYMASLGQSSDPALPSYHPNGITLRPGYIELITHETTAPGGRHREYRGFEGEIAFRTWRGPDYVYFPDRETAGVGWILGTAWWPYQQPTFVTPPFAGYVSGHSTFSRAAAEVLTELTGSPYFPGGLGEYICYRNQFLIFEDGPSVDVRLQWATYFDASEQSSFSRIWGGIHPPADDLPGRGIGSVVGLDAFARAERIFELKPTCGGDANGDGTVDGADLSVLLFQFGQNVPPGTAADLNGDGIVNGADLSVLLFRFGAGC